VLGVNISFGPYDTLSVNDTPSTGSITVSCDQSPPPTVTVQIGPGTSGTFLPRRLQRAGGGGSLGYYLYADAGISQVWGDGTGGTVAPSNRVFKNAPWVATVYGRIPAGQDVMVGSYSDALTITIQF